MKEFDAYIKVIDSYGETPPIHPGLVKAKPLKMGVYDINDPTPEEKYKTEE